VLAMVSFKFSKGITKLFVYKKCIPRYGHVNTKTTGQPSYWRQRHLFLHLLQTTVNNPPNSLTSGRWPFKATYGGPPRIASRALRWKNMARDHSQPRPHEGGGSHELLFQDTRACLHT
jgi:hypothetical protein